MEMRTQGKCTKLELSGVFYHGVIHRLGLFTLLYDIEEMWWKTIKNADKTGVSTDQSACSVLSIQCRILLPSLSERSNAKSFIVNKFLFWVVIDLSLCWDLLNFKSSFCSSTPHDLFVFGWYITVYGGPSLSVVAGISGWKWRVEEACTCQMAFVYTRQFYQIMAETLHQDVSHQS